jgi:Flp pilus assembly protein TadD
MEAQFNVAEFLAPSDGLLLVDRARAELSLGLSSEALATASRIVSLYPEAATGHALEGAAHLMLGDRDRARAALQLALDARWEEGSEAQREQAKWLLEHLGPAGR